MAYKTIGNAIAEWGDSNPFNFTMSEMSGPDDQQIERTIKIGLADLRQGFEDSFLLNVKDYFIERRHKITLPTINTEAKRFCALLHKVINLKLFDTPIRVINEQFMLCLGAINEKLKPHELENLLHLFTANPHSPIFAIGLQSSDFPLHGNKRGSRGRQINRILAKALNQDAIAHILDRCDTAFDAQKIDIAHYSFAHLAFAVFCRPESYRQIRLGDLRFDTESNKYFISIIPIKTGGHQPTKLVYQINEPLGVLLTKQRQNVVAIYGHLVPGEEISKLALFPSRRLRLDHSGWTSKYANNHFGMTENSCAFLKAYPEAIKNLIAGENFTLSANVLRHTVGTLLAQTGASAHTIQAVLKHASDTVCQAYVDIAFNGLINELSDAMRPAFLSHIPAFERFRSKNDPISIEKLIRSEDMETGQFEQTGECGKDTHNRGIADDQNALGEHLLTLAKKAATLEEVASHLIDEFHQLKHLLKDKLLSRRLEEAFVTREVVRKLDDPSVSSGALIRYHNPTQHADPLLEVALDSHGGREQVALDEQNLIEKYPLFAPKALGLKDERHLVEPDHDKEVS